MIKIKLFCEVNIYLKEQSRESYSAVEDVALRIGKRNQTF